MRRYLLLAFLLASVSVFGQTQIGNNIQVNAPKDLDSRTGKFSGGSWIPFANVGEANTAIPSSRRFPGLTVRIGTPQVFSDYHYYGGIADSNLVIKFFASSVDLTPYVRKTYADSNYAKKSYVDSSVAAVTVPWTQVTGKPSTFTPSAHNHSTADLLPGSATAGQVLKYNGTIWAPGTDNTGGSGGGGVSGFSFTNTPGITGTVTNATSTPTLELSLTKESVGLINVDNTSDASKPVSSATLAALNLKANLASPTFTGTPAVPTATPGTNTTQAASTAFVQAAVAASTAGVSTFNGRAGTVVPQTGDYTPAQVGLGNVNNTSDANKPVSTAAQAALDLKANLASPSLTGVPTAPTATTGTNTTQIATTAFVAASVAASTTGVATFNGRSGTVTPQSGDYTAAMVGLGNVNNTSDAAKPISTATQTALTTNRTEMLDSVAALRNRHNTDFDAVLDALETIDSVYGADTSNVPDPHTHALADLTQSGATNGQVIKWNGTVWAPAADNNSGGGSSTYSSLTDATTVDLPAVNTPLGTALAAKAPLASPTFTGTVSGVTKAMVGLGNADNTSDLDKPVSTLQSAADLAVQNYAVQRANHTGTQPVSTLSQSGATPGQQLQWNGSAWVPATPSGGTTYTAGAGISINGSNVISATGGIDQWDGTLDSVNNIPDDTNSVAHRGWVDRNYVTKTEYNTLVAALAALTVRVDSLEAGAPPPDDDTTTTPPPTGGGGTAPGVYAGVTGAVFHVHPDSGLVKTTIGDTVLAWANLATSSADSALATSIQGAIPPIRIPADASNPSYVRFNGSQMLLLDTLKLPTNTSTVTIYMVMRQGAASNGGILHYGPLAAPGSFLIMGPYPADRDMYGAIFSSDSSNGAYRPLNGFQTDDLFYVRAVFDFTKPSGQEITWYYNGTLTSTNDGTPTDNSGSFLDNSTLAIGGRLNQSFFGFFSLAEVVIFDHDLSSAEISAVEGKIVTDFGAKSSLF